MFPFLTFAGGFFGCQIVIYNGRKVQVAAADPRGVPGDQVPIISIFDGEYDMVFVSPDELSLVSDSE